MGEGFGLPPFFHFQETGLSTLLLPTTELGAVNRMLHGIGQSPVNSLDVTGIPDVINAIQFLRDFLLDVEAAGWSWNTDRNYVLNPDPSGYIAIPEGALEVDPEDKTVNIAVRRNPNTGNVSLYDADSQTFKFAASVPVKIIWAFPFDDIPQAAKTYVSIAAARKYQAQEVSSSSLDTFNEQDEVRAWRLLNRMERRVRDTNSFTANQAAQKALRRRFS